MTPREFDFEAPDHCRNAEEPLIEARAVTVRRGGELVLDRVDMAVRVGEIVTVIGPNGAGKSTLLKTLLGLVPPQSGTIQKRRGVRVAYVPQRLQVDAALPLAVERFLHITGGISAAARAAAISETGIAALLSHGLQTLSGGELQRVMLARALAREPDLLILDEPMQGIDVTAEAELYRLIGRTRSRRRVGIILVSHDLHLVFAETDHVVCLNRRVCCTGTPEAVRLDPEYARLFGGGSVAELAVYSHRHHV